MNSIYKLIEPITTTFSAAEGDRQETVSEVTIRPPKAKDMRAIDPVIGDIAKSIALMARLTGLATMQVDEMGIADFQAVGNIIEGFTQPGPPIGTMS